MGIRITGINTPIGGVEWEYTEKDERASVFSITPDRKYKFSLVLSVAEKKYPKLSYLKRDALVCNTVK